MANIPELFGSNVFGDETQKAVLPKPVYKALRATIESGADLDVSVANVVANAMKDWAVEKGVTHFTHWFQPLTGITAEKHDSFISPQSGGTVLNEFSGKELIKGEPDASSFPSGGLRATFEARGYTAWDPTSPAFIKDGILCIPTVFLSYSGEVLDWKTPLLRSMHAVSKSAVRVLKLFGQQTTRVITTVGPEQEYFLVPQELFVKRKDLVYTGRTLFGAPSPKGQELDDQYFGAIRAEVSAYMSDLNEELWKLGILAKTQHNEVAPAQHELAPIFGNTNIATDHNQLTMEVMKKVAEKHGLVCLLHEKPFAGVNGSGKHNNWSISTLEGDNLLEPGDKPFENTRFLLFLAAVIAAVDNHQDLLRVSVASAANDHRLGANEAPPAVISMFVGDELAAVLEAIASGSPYVAAAAASLASGVKAVPDFVKDTTDRNRTSPFAFTGNKFEFRMLGSSNSIAGANIILNTAVADVLTGFANALEGAADFEAAAKALIKETVVAHARIIFNGNNYAPAWLEEAATRGLLNLRTAADAYPYFAAPENIALFARHGIFTAAEVESRTEIMQEAYAKAIRIEALTAAEMAQKDILPAALAYSGTLAKSANIKAKLSLTAKTEIALVEEIDTIVASFVDAKAALDAAVTGLDALEEAAAQAAYCRDALLPALSALRAYGDKLEPLLAREALPYPTYGDLLFY
ncbi:MAG: glutamine synthetase III [Oscillospiraceae bacterium]|jgi:glutamine synthetase|nr:glutamine synthetase III [Oscillospiraceae bacterium]